MSSPSPFLPRRRAILLAAMAVALAAGLAVGRWLPDAGLRWGVIESLKALGMADVALGAADLSLFKGKVVVRGVSARTGAASPLDLDGVMVDFRWRPLLSKRLSFRTLDLDGAHVDLRRIGGAWVVNGLPVPVSAGEGGDWSFDADNLRLIASRLTVSDAGVSLAVDIDEMTIGPLRSWEPDTAVRWSLTGRVNGAALTATGTATPLAAAPGFTANLALEGFDLSALAAPAKLQGVTGPAGRLSARLTLSDGGGLGAKGTITVAKASATSGPISIAAGELRWSGGLDWQDGSPRLDGTAQAEALRIAHPDGTVEIVRSEFEGAVTPPHAEGVLRLEGMVGRLGEHRVDHAAAGAKGRFTVLPATAAAGIMPPLAGALDLWVEGLRVTDPASGRAIAAADRVDVAGVSFSPAEGGRLERLDAKGLAAKDERVRIGQARADKASMTPAGDLAVEGLSLGGVTARLVRTATGVEGFPAASDGGTAGDPPRITIGRLRITDAKVEFEDRTPSEPVRLTVDRVDLGVRGLDTGQPERDSPFRLKARLQGAQVAARGTLRPFAPSLSGSIKGTIDSLDLPPLSPYAADTLGVHLHTGQFDGELEVTVDKGALDGRMDMVLSKLFVAQPDPKAPLAVQADMPVETVLDLLRDSEQRIRLTIPVRGDLDRPDFDVSDAVSQAVGGALKTTVVTTLKVAFPVVALIGFVIDEASTPRLSLQPVAFTAGDAQLAPAQVERLETVAELLRHRPGVRLNVCGVAAMPIDWPVIAERHRRERMDLLARLRDMVGRPPVVAEESPDRDALTDLADRRAKAVKSWLIESGGIDPGRLFVCRPNLSETAEGGPRVDLLI